MRKKLLGWRAWPLRHVRRAGTAQAETAQDKNMLGLQDQLHQHQN
jgi:hypothetical protein